MVRGDLRRRRAQYDVIVMILVFISLIAAQRRK